MSNDFFGIACGLCSALTWGAGDFSGGIASKRNHVYDVVLFSQIMGGLLLIGLALGFGEVVNNPRDLVWGGAGGVFGMLGLLGLYSALSTGNMGIVAPLSALVTAILPILVSFFNEGLPGNFQIIGFCLGLLAVWILTYSGGSVTIGRREVGLAMASGLGFGLFFICIDQASTEIVFWPLVSARIISITFLLAIFVLRRHPPSIPRHRFPIVFLAGFFDSAGNGFFALASQMSRLDVSAVLASLYPASTVLLAWLLLRERLHSSQWLGVALACGALVLISL